MKKETFHIKSYNRLFNPQNINIDQISGRFFKLIWCNYKQVAWTDPNTQHANPICNVDPVDEEKGQPCLVVGLFS
jgi:hypothetical protein